MKELLFPKYHRKHTHAKLLEQLSPWLSNQTLPNTFSKSTLVWLEMGQFMSLQNMLLFKTVGTMKDSHHLHLMSIFPLPHTYWLVRERKMRVPNLPREPALLLYKQKEKVKAHISKHHRPRAASADSGFYSFWTRLLTSSYLTTSNLFCNNARKTVHQIRTVMKLRTGT